MMKIKLAKALSDALLLLARHEASVEPNGELLNLIRERFRVQLKVVGFFGMAPIAIDKDTILKECNALAVDMTSFMDEDEILTMANTITMLMMQFHGHATHFTEDELDQLLQVYTQPADDDNQDAIWFEVSSMS